VSVVIEAIKPLAVPGLSTLSGSRQSLIFGHNPLVYLSLLLFRGHPVVSLSNRAGLSSAQWESRRSRRTRSAIRRAHRYLAVDVRRRVRGTGRRVSGRRVHAACGSKAMTADEAGREFPRWPLVCCARDAMPSRGAC